MLWMWITCEITVKMAQNFHFRLKIHQNGWFQCPGKEMKRKIVQLNYILSFIFNFVLCIIYITTFWNSVAQSHTEHSNLNFWWPWSVLTRHWRKCNHQFLTKLAENSPIIIQNSSNPSSRKNLDLWPYNRPCKVLLLTCVVNCTVGTPTPWLCPVV